MIDEYNNKMNGADIADQLRNQYRPDHWMRNRKWWWAFLIWAIGVAGVNAWKVYGTYYDEEKKKGTRLPPKWSHVEFLEQLVYDFLYPERTSAHVKALKEMVSKKTFDDEISSTGDLSSFSGANALEQKEWDFTTQRGINEYCTEVKTCSITAKRINSGYFMRRLDGLRHNLVAVPAQGDKSCQYCRYKFNNTMDAEQRSVNDYMRNNRTQPRRCLVCNVNLCPECEFEWHGVDVTNMKQMLK